uniref:Exoribonuclease phosphorolytic domain-containing protein n=1 Tax=Xenopus tropicalis TaxID=8364 RepID=A0A6I8SIQ0_XENTR
MRARCWGSAYPHPPVYSAEVIVWVLVLEDRCGMGAETRGHLLCDLHWAPFSRRGPWSGSCPAGPSPHQAGLQLQESLELAMRLDRYPRGEVIVWVLVLEDRGSVLPATVSCASLPLADAGIEMFNLVLGCGLSRGPGGELLLDLDDDEEEAGSGRTMSLSLLPTLNQVSAWAFTDWLLNANSLESCKAGSSVLAIMLDICLLHPF